MRAALYARVSTEEQADEGHSLDAQLRVMRDYCARREWKVVAEYVDPGQSGRSMHRPAVERLLSDASQSPGPFDVVVVHKLDRWSRSIIDTIASLRDLNERNVAFAAATQNVDYTTPEGKLLLMMLAVFAEIYIDNLRVETTKGKKERAMKGLYNGSLPFPYMRSESKSAPPLINPALIDGYSLAMQMAADGARPSLIADTLNEAGYRTSGNWGQRPFVSETVTHILRNRFHLGEVEYRGQWMAGKHPPAIDPYTWQLVQDAVATRRLAPPKSNRATRAYPLRQLLYCAECGQSFIGTYQSGKRRYVDSSKRKKHACPERTTYLADDIEAQIGDIMMKVRLPSDWQVRALELLGDTAEKRHATTTRREAITLEMSRAKTLFMLGDIDEAEYKARRARSQEKLSELRPPPANENLERAARVLKDFGKTWGVASLTQREKMLHLLLNRVYMKSGSIVAIEPLTDFYPLLKTAGFQRTRERRVSHRDALTSPRSGGIIVILPPDVQFSLRKTKGEG